MFDVSTKGSRVEGGKYRRLLDVCRPRVQCGENTEDCLTCVDQGFNVGKIKKNV